MSDMLEPLYEREIIEYVKALDAQLTPEEREKHDRERRIDERWELLKCEVERRLIEAHPNHDCEEYFVLSELLACMDKLERGESVNGNVHTG